MWQSDDGAFSQDVALAESGGFALGNNAKRAFIVITEGKYILLLCTVLSMCLQFVWYREDSPDLTATQNYPAEFVVDQVIFISNKRTTAVTYPYPRHEGIQGEQKYSTTHSKLQAPAALPLGRNPGAH
jgi:hypothetical protein